MSRLIASIIKQGSHLIGVLNAVRVGLLSLWHWTQTLLLIGPLNVTFWRGTEEPVEVIDNISWTFLLLAISVVLQVLLQVGFRNVSPGWHFYWFAYLFSVGCIVQYGCLWALLGRYPGVIPAVVELTVSLALLTGLRFVRNISAAPFDLLGDLPKSIVNFPTAFRTTDWDWPLGAMEMTLYVLDCFFSVFVIGSLVVFVWRGAWTLLDLFLYPEDESLSALCSLIIGYAVVAVTFSLQAPMKRACDWLKGFWRLLALDCYVLFSFCGTINLWRGIWLLLNIYFFPDDPLLSYLLTHVFPFILLVLLNCSNSLLVRGVFIDGEEPDGKCVDFPTYYLRMFFQEQRKKKILKQSQRLRISSLASKADQFEKPKKFAPINDVGKGHVTVELPEVTRF